MAQSNIQPKKFGNKMRGDGVGKKLKKGRVSNIVMKYSFHKKWGLGTLCQLWITKIYKNKKNAESQTTKQTDHLKKAPLHRHLCDKRIFYLPASICEYHLQWGRGFKKKIKTREDTLPEIDQNMKILKS